MNSIAINGLAAGGAIGRRSQGAPDAGSDFPAQLAGEQDLPASTGQSGTISGRVGLLAPSSMAALIHAQTPQPGESGQTMAGLRLPTDGALPHPPATNLRGRALTAG